MYKFRISFLAAIVLIGFAKVKAYGTIDSEFSQLLISDTGYVFENVDFDYVDIYDNSDGSKTADIYGGYIECVGSFSLSTVNLYAGSISSLDAWDSSTVNVHDGSIYTLESHSTSRVNIFGGVFEFYNEWTSVSARSYSQVTISGGTFGDDLKASENSSITIYGTDFSIDSFSVGYGEITATSGILTGTLASGEIINNNFYIYDDATIVLVPEPATLFLLGLGSLALLRKRRA